MRRVDIGKEMEAAKESEVESLKKAIMKEAEKAKAASIKYPTGGVVSKTTFGYITCPTCSYSYPSGTHHICTSYIPTTTPYYPPVTVSTAPPPPMRDINWKEYTAARPPAKGEYIVVLYYPDTKQRDTYFTEYKYETLQWVDVPKEAVVTHYAKIELP